MSLRDKLLGAAPVKKTVVTLCDGETKVEVRSITAGDRQAWWDANAEHEKTCPPKLDGEGNPETKEALDAKGKQKSVPVLLRSTQDGLTQDEFIRGGLLVRAIFDPETGEPIFRPGEEGSHRVLAAVDSDLLWETALEVCALKRNDVEESAKNSSAGPSAG
ncbi:MAG: hypothetical protein KGR26_14365 [Cyanobacteria bacterium REEB65]|nr:hypothetical protein [Cyanobacteria bacterium REEB65]